MVDVETSTLPAGCPAGSKSVQQNSGPFPMGWVKVLLRANVTRPEVGCSSSAVEWLRETYPTKKKGWRLAETAARACCTCCYGRRVRGALLKLFSSSLAVVD